MRYCLFGAMSAAVLSITVMSANAALITGPTGVYDTDLDITWMYNANANAGAGSSFDGFADTNDGRMSWESANAWAESLSINGVTGWRLPTTAYPDATCGSSGISIGSSCTDSEMGHLFNFEGIVPGRGDIGPFWNIQHGNFNRYWSSTKHPDYTNEIDTFGFDWGRQFIRPEYTAGYAWAVHSGDVSTTVVPLPGAAWLFGSGLLLLLSRREK